MKILKMVGVLVLLACAIIFPQVFTDPTVTTIAVFTLIFAAVATGWNILGGYSGYISLGHIAYFGIGAYAMALFCLHWNIPGGYEPFLLVPLTALIAAVVSIPLGWIALRVRRHTFIVITIAMFFIIQLLAYNLIWLTNGSTGLGLPIPTDWGGYFFNYPFYYAALILLVIAVLVSWWIRNSKFGLGLLAIRDDEDRALGLGVKTVASKLAAFAIAAFFAGAAGAIYAYFVESIYPATIFDPNFDVAVVLMVFLGGLGTISGPILGALIMEPLQQYLNLQYGENGYNLIILGGIFLLVMLILPRGILPTLGDLWRKYRAMREQDTAVQAEEGMVITALPGRVGRSTAGRDESAPTAIAPNQNEPGEGINV
ncbi:MAG TPA: branched-chain amino acid ABC transporter permease [Ktedonobacteraceae bacterium]|jgi:branched-chain amino acid transport system permease protein|nr:branched-chain amino acid ABC transporter permease [Ktedonobacteraceae bacterium]